MTDLYLNRIISFGYKDCYNYYDIDVDKTLLLRKSDREYFVRYNDVNKEKILPLQLKIEHFYLDELQICPNYTLLSIHSEDNEFFIKCREIEDKINELLGIDDPTDFVEITLDDEDEFILLEIEKNTRTIRDKHRNDLVFVIAYVINSSLQASLVQYCANNYSY